MTDYGMFTTICIWVTQEKSLLVNAQSTEIKQMLSLFKVTKKQQRHGMKDGSIGKPSLLKSLNVEANQFFLNGMKGFDLIHRLNISQHSELSSTRMVLLPLEMQVHSMMEPAQSLSQVKNLQRNRDGRFLRQSRIIAPLVLSQNAL